MLRRAFSAATVCSVVVLVTATWPERALAALDPPDLTVSMIDRSSVRLSVTAGSSGTPAGFTVEWMSEADYQTWGGWPAAGHPAILVCDFTGTPTLTTVPGVPDYALGPGVSIIVEVGDLSDETGVYTYDGDELPWGSGFVLRAYANATDSEAQSAPSATLHVSTLAGGIDCVFTQGYWKNHPEAWPAASLQLGAVINTAGELLDIFNTPAQGNGLIFLAHQLIATKLNLGAGADPTPIQAAIDAADALIGALVIPPVGGGFIAPADASALTEQLDQFNNGLLGVECNPVAVQSTTWSTVKDTYRD